MLQLSLKLLRICLFFLLFLIVLKKLKRLQGLGFSFESYYQRQIPGASLEMSEAASCEVPVALPTSSGASALHVALLACNLGPQDRLKSQGNRVMGRLRAFSGHWGFIFCILCDWTT